MFLESAILSKYDYHSAVSDMVNVESYRHIRVFKLAYIRLLYYMRPRKRKNPEEEALPFRFRRNQVSEDQIRKSWELIQKAIEEQKSQNPPESDFNLPSDISS